MRRADATCGVLALLLWVLPGLAGAATLQLVKGWEEVPAPAGWTAWEVTVQAPQVTAPLVSLVGLVEPYELSREGVVVKPLGPPLGHHGGWRREHLELIPGVANRITVRIRDDQLPAFASPGRTLMGDAQTLYSHGVRSYFPRAAYSIASAVLGLVTLMIFMRRREQRLYLSFSTYAIAHGLTLMAGGGAALVLWDNPAAWDHLRLAGRTFSPLGLVAFLVQVGPRAPRWVVRALWICGVLGTTGLLTDLVTAGRTHAFLWLWANFQFVAALSVVGWLLVRAMRKSPWEFLPSTLAVFLVLASVVVEVTQWGAHASAMLVGVAHLALLLTMGDLMLRRFSAVYGALQEEVRARDEFLGVVSHELRNPLAAISAGVDVLTRQHAVPETVRHLEMLRRQANLLARLMDDLLDLGRIRAGRLKVETRPLLLTPVLESAVEGMRHAAEAKRLDLTLLPLDQSLAVEADPVRLEQMLTNLVRNAIQHTAAGGRVTVSTQAEEQRVRIIVRDTGRGLSREALAQLFRKEPGVPTPPVAHSEGMGVGLSVVRRLATMHGGSVSAQSGGADQGSTFTLGLRRAAMPTLKTAPSAPATSGPQAASPVAAVSRPDSAAEVLPSTPDGFAHGRTQSPHSPGAPPASPPAALTQTPGPAPDRRVLVIDDNANLRLSMRLLLEHSGYRVQEAEDGLSGLECLEGGGFDAAVVDLRMPQLDGMEVARRVRALPHGARLRLVALTGMAQPEEHERALQAGFDQVLLKPADPDKLAAALR